MAIVFFRVALAAATIVLLALALRRLELLRLRNKAPLPLGLLAAVHWSSYFAAIQETSVASAVVITYVAPVFMALLARPVLDEKVTWVAVLALLASLGGVALISFGGGTDEVRPLGVGLALLAALSFALLLVLYKRYARDMDPITFVLYESIVAAIVLAPAALVADYSLDARGVGSLLLLGVVLTGMVTVLYVSALRWIPVTTAGILTYLEPVSAALLAVLLLHEPLTVSVVIGGSAIFAAGGAVLFSAPGGPEASWLGVRRPGDQAARGRGATGQWETPVLRRHQRPGPRGERLPHRHPEGQGGRSPYRRCSCQAPYRYGVR